MPSERFSELPQFDVDPLSVRLLPYAFCERNELVVLGTVDFAASGSVSLGMVHPDDWRALRQAADYLQRRVTAHQLNRYEVLKALRVGYGGPESTDYVIHSTRSAPDSSAPEFVDHLLVDAVRRGASDIHIEGFGDDIDLRFRIDGILHHAFTHISPDTIGGVVNRIKIMAGLDITERRAPQDGRIRCRVGVGGELRSVDYRISIVPNTRSEDVVIRVLDPHMGLIPVNGLGMSRDHETVFIQLLQNPEGLILVTGPTGSGKTTTLYAGIAQVNDGRRKIITAEDPIEYFIPKVNQKQVSEHMPLNSLLRALLRQDPDVMLVGEIRDHETGDVALRAASTGHVVLSTLHTSDAIGAVPRLRAIGLDNADIADSLVAVIAQRLVRRCCTECREPDTVLAETKAFYGSLIRGMTPSAGRGCAACNRTGYRGRRGIFEFLSVDPTLQDMIASGAHSLRLREHARQGGFRSIVNSGINLVAEGETTLEELTRVLPYRQVIDERRRREEIS